MKAFLSEQTVAGEPHKKYQITQLITFLVARGRSQFVAIAICRRTPTEDVHLLLQLL
ncbi:hypothetical protein [Scytonema millei]|uniref:Uncharacterized protein n=1 Tax=Scytonema millei VB511283 TaxID=1245923 RepID=A0A9X5EAH3_9CYAN|nr:hypothetical protein [Scytonema millei]NHC38139.1 hypothetical protein [Scytonema millei VB511283]